MVGLFCLSCPPRDACAHRRRKTYLALVITLCCGLWSLPAPVAAQSPDPLPLSQLQGDTAASPHAGQTVAAVGLVTALTTDGFYLQDPVGDGDPRTSDGLFVYTGRAPQTTVGDCVTVVGPLIEFYAKTEFSRPRSVTPAATCGATAVTPAPLPDVAPGQDPATVWEAYEGMLVTLELPAAVVHGPTRRYASGEAEIAIWPATWQRQVGDTPLFHDQPLPVPLRYVSNRADGDVPTVHAGDHIAPTTLVGILDYNFGKYQLLPLAGQPLTITRMARAPELPPPAPPDTYGVCTYNVHGLGRGTEQHPDPLAYADALAAHAAVIAGPLQSCVVLALQETGTPDDALALAEWLAQAHGLHYTALALPGPDTRSAEFPLTNSLLVATDRAETRAETRAGMRAGMRVEVAELTQLQACAPRDYDVFAPGACRDGYPVFSRPPLVAALRVHGPWADAQRLWVINNHWKSKAGNETANARLRLAQADAVAAAVQSITKADPAASVIVLGDLNDFVRGPAVEHLQTQTGLRSIFDWLPPLTHATYRFNGLAQVLDHLLLSPGLAEQVAYAQVVPLHAAYADAPSDHDPVLVWLRPGGSATLAGNVAFGGVEATARDLGGAPLATAVSDALGEFRLWGLPPGPATLHLALPAAWDAAYAPRWVDARPGLTTLDDLPTASHPVATALAGWLAALEAAPLPATASVSAAAAPSPRLP